MLSISHAFFFYIFFFSYGQQCKSIGTVFRQWINFRFACVFLLLLLLLLIAIEVAYAGARARAIFIDSGSQLRLLISVP